MSTSRIAVVLACVLTGSQATAQSKVYRIGALSETWGPTPGLVGLRDGLTALGYRENHDFFIGVRFTSGDVPALGPAAKQLVDYGVDLIYATGDVALLAASAATSSIPIVCRCNPVALGVAESFARPGGNVTGVTDLDPQLGAKRLQLFRELVPAMRRVVYVHDATDEAAASQATSYRAGGSRLGIDLVVMAVESAEGAQAILGFNPQEFDGVLAPVDGGKNIPGLVLEVANRAGVPAMFPGGAFWVERGALISYGPDWHESGRLAARAVHEIFQGNDPGTIPIQVNPIVTLGLNLSTAERLGLEIPESLLLAADVLVE